MAVTRAKVKPVKSINVNIGVKISLFFQVKLIIIGHAVALATFSPFKLLIDYLREKDKLFELKDENVLPK